jgi:hypothetical protein
VAFERDVRRTGTRRGSCTLRIGRQIAKRQARKRMLISTTLKGGCTRVRARVRRCCFRV